MGTSSVSLSSISKSSKSDSLIIGSEELSLGLVSGVFVAEGGRLDAIFLTGVTVGLGGFRRGEVLGVDFWMVVI